MNSSQLFILVAIVALAVTAFLVFRRRPGTARQLSPMGGLAFSFVLAGLIFSEDRLIGYGLMAVGILLAFLDMIQKTRKK